MRCAAAGLVYSNGGILLSTGYRTFGVCLHSFLENNFSRCTNALSKFMVTSPNFKKYF